jgi:uncharacterized protein YccT (UPF0319 family)
MYFLSHSSIDHDHPSSGLLPINFKIRKNSLEHHIIYRLGESTGQGNEKRLAEIVLKKNLKKMKKGLTF